MPHVEDKNLPEVKIGEIWEDADPRSRGRRLRVLEVINPQGLDVEPYVVCEVVSSGPNSFTAIGKKATIKRRRFKPTHNGYRKVADA